MKRWMIAWTLALVAGSAMAQAPFTIVRPADGAKVREVVKVQVPKNSIPDGGYVGVYVDGKFVEATVLEPKGDFYEYPLDTKASKVADGKHRIEMVLYAEAGDRARILDRTSVEVTVANTASISIPENGLLLRYAFRRGTELIYNIELAASLLTISEAQARRGGRAAELPVDIDRFRMLYAVDNSYGDGDGLIRMQALPLPGKDYIFFKLIETAGGEVVEGRKYDLSEMHPLYMRLTNRGLEKFGAVPLYVPIEGSATGGVQSDLYVAFPFPTLPDKAVKPGDAWQGQFLAPTLRIDQLYDTQRITSRIPARGELVGVEWEMGHPCAKIKTSIAQGVIPARAGSDGQQGMGGERVSLEQTTWFALDKGIPVRIILDATRDTRMASSGGGAGFAGGSGGSSRGGAGVGPTGSGGTPGVGGIQQTGKGGFPLSGNTGGGGTTGPGPSGMGTQRQGAPGGGGGQTQFVRLRYRVVLALQK